MELNQQSREFLGEAAKWATILSIIGFISIGILVIMSFSIGSIMASLPTSDLGVSAQMISMLYLIIAGIYFIPVYFLFQFGVKTKKAIDANDTDLLTFGLKKLKSHYKFIGIVMIIVFSLNIVVLLIGSVTALFV